MHRRFLAECTPRLPFGTHAGVVLSFGVNDTMHESGVARVTTEASIENLRNVLKQLNKMGWSVLIAGPPAVDAEEHNQRIVALDTALAAECAHQAVPYVSVVRELQGHEVWQREVREGDGAHPGAGGYESVAALLRPAWDKWLAALRAGHSSNEKRPDRQLRT